MTDPKEIALYLRTYNKWRRGDESLEQPNPTELGIMIEQACRVLEGCDETKRNLEECRSALKMITELPASTANNIAVIALRNTEQESDKKEKNYNDFHNRTLEQLGEFFEGN